MPARHLDKLVKSFLTVGSDPTPTDLGFKPFNDLQDPTYLSFKIDFFPDLGYSVPDDIYSTGGLFREAKDQGVYSFYDSAAEYLKRIGAPNRQYYLEVFTHLLRKLQEEAPWYFQSISGVADLYKIDPAINFRGKDKVLTIDCLESIDLRTTLLADLYRNIAFDLQGMREVLPINLRTFNMAIHVLEFRRFNTTFGIIADQLSPRATKGQDKQQEDIAAKRRNVFNQGGSSLFTGTFDNLNGLANNLNSQLGGLFTNLGQQAGQDYDTTVQSAFEAISVQTFYLKECEFDFYSEAPGYLEALSVKDIPEASHKFMIKVGKINKTGVYPFYNYVVSEYAKFSKVNTIAAGLKSDLGRANIAPAPHYFEQTDPSNPPVRFPSPWLISVLIKLAVFLSNPPTSLSRGFLLSSLDSS